MYKTDSQNFSHNHSVILIGMRGVGKSLAAKFLSCHWNTKRYSVCVDMDDVFTCSSSRFHDLFPTIFRDNLRSCLGISEFVNTFGWDLFRKIEYLLLCRQLRETPVGAIIATGGGIVDYLPSRLLLLRWPIVIFLHRLLPEDVSDTSGLGYCIQFGNNDHRPPLPLTLHEMYKRRISYYCTCSTHIWNLDVPFGTGNVKEIKKGILDLVGSSKL